MYTDIPNKKVKETMHKYTLSYNANKTQAAQSDLRPCHQIWICHTVLNTSLNKASYKNSPTH